MRIIFSAFFLFLVIGLLHAQNADFETWTGVGVYKKVKKKYTFSLNEEIRLNNNSTTVKALNTDLSFSIELSKYFSVGVGYRYSLRNKINGYFPKHRGDIDISIVKEFYDLEVSFKTRFLVEKETYTNDKTDLYPSYTNRNKLKLEYNIRKSKTDPFFSVESFHSLNAINLYNVVNLRYALGVVSKLKFNTKLNIALLYNVEYDSKYPSKAFVANISFSKKL